MLFVIGNDFGVKILIASQDFTCTCRVLTEVYFSIDGVPVRSVGYTGTNLGSIYVKENVWNLATYFK